MTDLQICPRARENGMTLAQMKPPFNGEMVWRADHSCSYCGSLDPEVFMSRLEAGDVTLIPTDKNYKVYIRNESGEPFGQTFRQGCPASPCPDIVGEDGSIDVDKCTHWQTRPTDETKFYFQHLDEEQKQRFIELHNEGKLKIGMPGHFYSLPFFCRREE